jgi:hypothetical protein
MKIQINININKVSTSGSIRLTKLTFLNYERNKGLEIDMRKLLLLCLESGASLTVGPVRKRIHLIASVR